MLALIEGIQNICKCSLKKKEKVKLKAVFMVHEITNCVSVKVQYNGAKISNNYAYNTINVI